MHIKYKILSFFFLRLHHIRLVLSLEFLNGFIRMHIDDMESEFSEKFQWIILLNALMC